jgi:hypothetical protein
LRFQMMQAKFNIARKRVKEIRQIMLGRHGGLPDTDDCSIYLELAAHHLKPRDGDLHFALESWARSCGTLAVPAREIDRIVRNVRARPYRMRADTIAKRLGLTYAKRARFGVTTIGAIDADKVERLRRRKLKAREREHARRRAKGVKTREKYIANSISRAQPWITEGVSRRTWYRRHAKVVAQVRAQHTGTYSCARTCATSKDRESKRGKKAAVRQEMRKAIVLSKKAKPLLGRRQRSAGRPGCVS